MYLLHLGIGYNYFPMIVPIKVNVYKFCLNIPYIARVSD